jgi:photosystem II stability/assembly factor-like uncharacterized protein
VPSKIRHLPGLVCLALLMAACSSGHDNSASPEPTSSVSSTPQENDGSGPGDEENCADADNEQECEEQQCEEADNEAECEEEGAGDPDADLPGADRYPHIPEDPFLLQRLLPNGVPNLNAFRVAGQQAAAVRAMTQRVSPELAKPAWKFLGPKTVGGRVVDAATDPEHKGGLFVATSTAGVWHSTDSGATFTSAWPDNITHAMGALAIASDGTLYAGTGETNPGGGSITYGGDGIYKSTDSGATWTHVGLETSGTIGRIVVDPKDPNTIWVAVSGNLFVPGVQRGVYVSTDGGDTWKRSFKPPNKTTGAADIAIDPNNSKHLVAGLWDHLRKPDVRRYTGAGSGIWETKNAGKSWQRLGTSEGLPAPSADTGRIGVAFAPSDSKRLYAVYANGPTGSFQNFFTSTDGGATWVRPDGADSLGGSQSTYGWWFARVFVDPDDADHLYLLGLNMYQSTNGADSFSVVGGGLHADQHVVAWDTHQGGDMYIGNDGGLYASVNGTTWTHSPDEPWSQYVSIDVAETDPSRFMGGLQDNGTRVSWSGFQDIIGGDGQDTLINPTDENNYYGCYQYGNCTGFDSGAQFRLPLSSDRFPFFTPMIFKPGDPSTIYSGGNKLNRSTDGGHTFQALTGDLGHGGGDDPNYPYGTISALGVAPGNTKIIWVGTDNGYLYRSTDNGAHFTQLKTPVDGRPWITRLAVDPKNSKSVYLTLSGYRSGDNAPYVLHSSNSGKSWTDITANLPKAPVSALVIVGSTLYVGTDVGVFSSAKSDPSWKSVGHGLPQQIITDLRYVKNNSTLYASTFGMGGWSVKL